MRRVLAVLIAATILVLGGCHRDRSIVGTWATRVLRSEPQASWERSSITGVTTYKADGTFAMEEGIISSEASIGINVRSKGTWKLDGAKLQLHWVDLDQRFKGEDAEKNTKLLQKQKAGLMETFNMNGPSIVTWSGDNRFFLTDAGGTKTTCTRMVGGLEQN